MAVLSGVAVWAAVLGAGWLLLGLAGKLLYRRRITAPFQTVRVKRRRFVPAWMEIHRTCGDCGQPSRLAVIPDDFDDLLAGDLAPSRCGPCRAVWLAANPLANRRGIMGRVSVGKPDHPAV